MLEITLDYRGRWNTVQQVLKVVDKSTAWNVDITGLSDEVILLLGAKNAFSFSELKSSDSILWEDINIIYMWIY